MSFFGNLLGGTLQGVGAGMSAVAADEERLDRERMLLRERSQAALDLQQQRAQDRLYQAEQMAQMKAELGGGSGGGGGKGINLAAMAAQARTPEDQQRVINLARTFAGNDAGALMADQLYGRPQMTGAPATAGDFARYDRAGDMDAAPPTTTLERAAYDSDKGRQALQRAYTMFLDPGKLDDHAKGERQFGLNDFGAANAAQVMQRGGSLPEASAAFQKYSSTVDDSEKNRLRQSAIDASNARTAAQSDNSAANRASQDARALDRQIAGAYKQLGEARPKDKPALQARIQEMEARRDAMDGAALAPALNDYQPGATTKAPSPTAVVRNPAGSPKSLADAWRAKIGAAR